MSKITMERSPSEEMRSTISVQLQQKSLSQGPGLGDLQRCTSIMRDAINLWCRGLAGGRADPLAPFGGLGMWWVCGRASAQTRRETGTETEAGASVLSSSIILLLRYCGVIIACIKPHGVGIWGLGLGLAWLADCRRCIVSELEALGLRWCRNPCQPACLVSSALLQATI